MGFKGLKSLCFRDCGAGHVRNSAQHPCFLSNLLYSYLLHFSSEWDVYGLVGKIFQCRMCSWAEVNHLEPLSIQKNQNVQFCPM